VSSAHTVKKISVKTIQLMTPIISQPIFFFHSYSNIFMPTLCTCRGLLLQLIPLNDTYTQQDFSGRGIGLS